MKIITLNLLSAVFLWIISCCIATAQEPVAQADEIKDSETEEIIQDDTSTTGKFQSVTVEPSAKSDVTLQFPVTMANKTVAVEALDGGEVTSASITSAIGEDGSLGFSFQVTDQPGLHRVLVIDPNAGEDDPQIVGVVEFEVPTPLN